MASISSVRLRLWSSRRVLAITSERVKEEEEQCFGTLEHTLPNMSFSGYMAWTLLTSAAQFTRKAAERLLQGSCLGLTSSDPAHGHIQAYAFL